MKPCAFGHTAALLLLMCVPGNAWAQLGDALDLGAAAKKPTISVQGFQEANGAHPGSRTKLALTVKLSEGWHVNSHTPLEDFLIPTHLDVEAPEGIGVADVVYPEHRLVTLGFSGEPVAVYDAQFSIGLAVTLAEDVAPGTYALKGTLRYQACNDAECWAPLTQTADIALTVVPQSETLKRNHEDVFKAIVFSRTDTASAEVPPPPEQPVGLAEPGDDWRALADGFSTAGLAAGYMPADDFLAFLDSAESGRQTAPSSMFHGKGIIVILLLTLLGGLALNLTPCVLPMIPINIAIIGAGAQAGSRSRGFILGGLYGLGIALVYGVLGVIAVTAGKVFGAFTSSPWFNLGIAIVFVILALATFEVFLLDFSRFQAKIGGRKKKGSYMLAFFMGGVIALLAGACVAPVVIAVLVFSQELYAKGSTAALLLPFVLGLGMAAPWPFAGAGLSLLPKPGKWMGRVKFVFGIFILLMAAYYGHQAYGLFMARYAPQPAPVQDGQWVSSLSDGLAQAKEEGKPVLIDFWATWCKNCKVMDKVTLEDAEVITRLADYVKIKYQAELPEDSPAREVMDYFGARGLPTYVVLRIDQG